MEVDTIPFALKTSLLVTLKDRHLGDGGFWNRDEGDYRPDATAWAILALQTWEANDLELTSARARLAEEQQADGRVSLVPERPEAFWPTPLAILAWNRIPEFLEARNRAIRFLLNTSGRHFPKKQDSVIGHDPSIRGWPWIDGTHSWAIPSSLAIISLTAAGYGGHDRVQEAQRLLLDRQLPGGGWNYGNTTVFGQVLHPMPEATGVVLTALAGRAGREEVGSSLAYLAGRTAQVRTPLSLCWGLLGLAAWGARPPEAGEWLQECWQRQERYGAYDTTALALLVLAALIQEGVPAAFQEPPEGLRVQ